MSLWIYSLSNNRSAIVYGKFFLPSQQFDVSLCVQNNPQLSNMEFGRRLAVERELEKTPYFSLPNACEYVHVSVHVSYTSDFHIRTHL